MKEAPPPPPPQWVESQVGAECSVGSGKLAQDKLLRALAPPSASWAERGHRRDAAGSVGSTKANRAALHSLPAPPPVPAGFLRR